MERIATPEILDRIFVGLPKYPDLNEMKNHPAEILTGADVPVFEHSHHHRSELLQRKFPNTLE